MTSKLTLKFFKSQIVKTWSIILLLVAIGPSLTGQTLWQEINGKGDFSHVDGLLVQNDLFIYGAKTWSLGQSDSIFMLKFNTLNQSYSSLNLGISKTGVIADFDVNQFTRLITKGQYNAGSNSISFFKLDNGMNAIDSVSILVNNGVIRPFKTILMDSAIYHLSLYDGVNQNQGFLISKLDLNLNLIDSAIVKYPIMGPGVSCEFLYRDDSLSVLTTLAWRPGIYVSEHRFSLSDFGNYDTIVLIHSADSFFSNHQHFLTDAGVILDNNKNFILGMHANQQMVPHPTFEARDVGLIKLNRNGNLINSVILGRPDTLDRHGDQLLVEYGQEGALTGVLPHYGLNATSYEEFIFGSHPTLVDVYLNSKQFLDIRNRWTISNGEYIRLNSMVPDAQNDLLYAVTTSYDYNDSLYGKIRDLHIYKVEDLNQHLDKVEIKLNTGLKVWPNPASTEVINIQGLDEGIHLINFFNIQGQPVYQTQVSVLNFEVAEVDLVGLRPGFYLVSIQSCDQIKPLNFKLRVQ